MPATESQPRAALSVDRAAISTEELLRISDGKTPREILGLQASDGPREVKRAAQELSTRISNFIPSVSAADYRLSGLDEALAISNRIITKGLVRELDGAVIDSQNTLKNIISNLQDPPSKAKAEIFGQAVTLFSTGNIAEAAKLFSSEILRFTDRDALTEQLSKRLPEMGENTRFGQRVADLLNIEEHIPAVLKTTSGRAAVLNLLGESHVGQPVLSSAPSLKELIINIYGKDLTLQDAFDTFVKQGVRQSSRGLAMNTPEVRNLFFSTGSAHALMSEQTRAVITTELSRATNPDKVFAVLRIAVGLREQAALDPFPEEKLAAIKLLGNAACLDQLETDVVNVNKLITKDLERQIFTPAMVMECAQGEVCRIDEPKTVLVWSEIALRFGNPTSDQRAVLDLARESALQTINTEKMSVAVETGTVAEIAKAGRTIGDLDSRQQELWKKSMGARKDTAALVKQFGALPIEEKYVVCGLVGSDTIQRQILKSKLEEVRMGGESPEQWIRIAKAALSSVPGEKLTTEHIVALTIETYLVSLKQAADKNSKFFYRTPSEVRKAFKGVMNEIKPLLDSEVVKSVQKVEDEVGAKSRLGSLFKW